MMSAFSLAMEYSKSSCELRPHPWVPLYSQYKGSFMAQTNQILHSNFDNTKARANTIINLTSHRIKTSWEDIPSQTEIPKEATPLPREPGRTPPAPSFAVFSPCPSS
mmetsp:Transcript_27762/g.50603  ORF Transcript_27762/g.50603 Transcript_27762/m.50603 type:complete len:107 (-) Transcript_27762:1634-1954(-)